MAIVYYITKFTKNIIRFTRGKKALDGLSKKMENLINDPTYYNLRDEYKN